MKSRNLDVNVALLSDRGWEPGHPAVKDVVPAILRGNNLVVVLPPAPVYATPVLSSLAERRAETGKEVLVVAQPAGLSEWASLLSWVAPGQHPAPLLALGLRQAERRFRNPEGAGVVVASPDTAVALRQRSLIVPDRVGTVLAAWPERWEDAEALTTVLQDLPREVQRIILTSDPGAVAQLVERHAWRAMTVGMNAASVEAASAPVTTVAVPWDRRTAVLALVIERLGTDRITVWTADSSRHAELEGALQATGAQFALTSSIPDGPGPIVGFDPPWSERLRELQEAGPVTLLVPPGTERWIERIAPTRKPLVVSWTVDSVNAELARRRSLIEQAVREEPLDEGLLALGPVLDQHDAAAVAAALYQMWTRLPRATLQKQLETGAAAAPRTRIWVGAGKRDEVGVGDLVGLLINEVRLDRSAIGKIELRDTFTLVDVPAPEADRIVQAISGKTLRKRRLVARVDRKP